MKKEKKIYNLLMILVIIVLFVATVFFRILDIKGDIQIGAEAWLEYIGNMINTIIAFVGIAITIYKLFEEKEIKETPQIILKKASKIQHPYWCFNDKEEITQKAIIFLEIINKGNEIIKFPQIINDLNVVSPIMKNDRLQELDLIEPQIYGANNRYIIQLDIKYFEGMNPYIVKNFKLAYKNVNNKTYITPFSIEIEKYNPNKYNIYVKEQERI